MKFKLSLYLILLNVGVLMQAFVVLFDNPLPLAAGLLALFAVCIAQALLLPSLVAGGVSLALLAAWIAVRWAAGQWVTSELPTIELEIVLLALNSLLAIRLRQGWEKQRADWTEMESLVRTFQLVEVSAGLLPRDIGELRLNDEINRAADFRRPVALMLVEVLPATDAIPAELVKEARQTVARQLLNLLTVHDTPFRVDDNRVGVVLPERDWQRLYKDADAIENALRSLTLTRGIHQSSPLSTYVNVNFGLSVYEGAHQTATALMVRAEKSLKVHKRLIDAVLTYNTVTSVREMLKLGEHG